MHAQLESYCSDFLDVKSQAQRLARNTDPDTMQAPLDEDTWSPVQCLDHLNTAGWLLLRSMEQTIRRGQDRGPYGEPPFQYGFVSRWYIRSMRPSSGWTFRAPSIYEPEPTDTLYPREALDEFRALQDQFSDCVAAAEGLDLRRLRMSSPAIPIFRVSLGAWFEATIAHERRHLEQARSLVEGITAS